MKAFMTPRSTPRALLLATCAASAAVLMSGCVVAPPYRQVVYQSPPIYTQPAPVYTQGAPVVVQPGYPQQQQVVVYQDPPPPQVEVVGVAPAPGYFWVGGVWLWQANRHVWSPGRWEAPRAGQVYVPHQWVRGNGGGWRMNGGYWRH